MIRIFDRTDFIVNCALYILFITLR